ncbi:ribosomal protein S18 acetylase RimI-like enzyme [Methylohalomonas lacus]|uniref:Ribosomal protein S18 acetylase RimI-like enzyme n=1 Tax=Methylohalomonas lacus TaxID=398773 RepID=A0AAE3L1I7_9GAMM|nr:GNAT family N-acetyltransferase [Methylohalomonas lacus]MCS3903625.1 ribosomal protein S18 acetylase RimI-like enzyme [Methylohalomonas lacus]
MEYGLRQATEDDYEFCYDLTKQNMYDLFCRHWGGWVDSEFRKGFVIENIQILLVHGQRIGYFCCKVSEDSIYIDNLQIASRYQGRGIGGKILSDFLDRHRDTVIKLTTFVDNPAAKLYERLDFQVVEKNGPTIKMEKNLTRLCRAPTSNAGEH